MENKKLSLSEKLASFYFFRIYIEVKIKDKNLSMFSKDEVDKMDMNEVAREWNAESAITLENWNEKKDIFFKQRMAKYKDSYTLNEKIKSELKKLKILIIANEHEHLDDRYKKYLKSKLNQKEKTNKSDAEKAELHPEIFKDNKFEVWQSMFDAFKITESNYSTDIDFMFEVMKYNDYIHSHIGLTNIRNWINKKYEIAFEKIRYTDPNSNANKKRLAIFNEIISK